MLIIAAISARAGCPACMHANMMMSFDQNPPKGGMPHIESAATRLVHPVTGAFEMISDILLKFLVPDISSIEPEFRNNKDLATL